MDKGSESGNLPDPDPGDPKIPEPSGSGSGFATLINITYRTVIYDKNCYYYGGKRQNIIFGPGKIKYNFLAGLLNWGRRKKTAFYGHVLEPAFVLMFIGHHRIL